MGHTPVRISTIKPEREISFDLFIYFKEQYLRYLPKGAVVESALHSKLKSQDITRFFILDIAEEAYHDYLDKILAESVRDPNLSAAQKIDIVASASSSAFDQMEKNGGTKQSYKLAKTAATNLKQLVTENPGILKEFFRMGRDGKEKIIGHGMNVSVLVGKFATSLKYPNKVIENLMVSGLLHPIGLIKLDESIQSKFLVPTSKLTPSEYKEWSRYPEMSAFMLSGKDWVDGEVVELVKNHAEKLSGSGPYKVKKLSKEQELLSLVNTYTRKVEGEGLSPLEAIKDVQISELGNYDLELIKQFRKMLKDDGILDLSIEDFMKKAA